MKTRVLSLIFIFCLSIVSRYNYTTESQVDRWLRKAKSHMVKREYEDAVKFYNKVLRENENADAKINIAFAYMVLGDTEYAEYWYGQVVQMPQAKPIDRLYYAQQLQANGKCDLAKEWYMFYSEAVPEDQRGQYLVQACDYEDELRTKNAGIYQIHDVDFSSEYNDWGVAFYKDGLSFARDDIKLNKKIKSWTRQPVNKLLYVWQNKFKTHNGLPKYTSPRIITEVSNSQLYNATATYKNDYTEVFFTKNDLNQDNKGKGEYGHIRLKSFSANIVANQWKNIRELPFNSDAYSVANPVVTPDGKTMYFSSNMEGGFGGMDLFKSNRVGDTWGPAINLGARINTEGDEVFPYYKDSKLYFSSESHVGLGGLDIYYMEEEEGSFGEIINMGYPINTISDDFGIVLGDGEIQGYLVSDREGGKGGDDIYSFVKSFVQMEVQIYDAVTKIPIKGASLINDCTGETMVTDKAGKIVFDMKLNQYCMFDVIAESYKDKRGAYC